MRTRLSELAQETVQEILTLRERGTPFRKIASSVGISHGSVIRLVNRETKGDDLTRPPPRLPARLAMVLVLCLILLLSIRQSAKAQR